jgi:hypothetical protein
MDQDSHPKPSQPLRPPQRLAEQLQRHPLLAQRIQELMDLADRGELSAHQVEGQLIKLIRQTGHDFLHSWAQQIARSDLENVPNQTGARLKKKLPSNGTAPSG